MRTLDTPATPNPSRLSDPTPDGPDPLVPLPDIPPGPGPDEPPSPAPVAGEDLELRVAEVEAVRREGRST